MVSFGVEVDEVTDSGIACTVEIPSGPLDVSVYVMATFYADVTKGKETCLKAVLSIKVSVITVGILHRYKF